VFREVVFAIRSSKSGDPIFDAFANCFASTSNSPVSWQIR
ncbi:MAG: hypothetical protein ACI8W8_001658, partial [Rhodothermales bacterium]